MKKYLVNIGQDSKECDSMELVKKEIKWFLDSLYGKCAYVGKSEMVVKDFQTDENGETQDIKIVNYNFYSKYMQFVSVSVVEYEDYFYQVYAYDDFKKRETK